MQRLLVLFSITVSAVLSATIDNGIIGEPEVECTANAIKIAFNTKADFEGHVYVKGQYDTKGCRTDATLQKSAELTVPFDSCEARRQRSTNPKGLFVSATVVITFHPMFITMVDRAYNVKCFYMEADKTVSAELGVSMLSTLSITRNVPMPTCTYQVLKGDENGAPVAFAAVGDPVYHKWSCQNSDDAGKQTAGAFCMTVHSCSVDNGQGRQVLLLDENGCAVDEYLLDNLKYSGDVVAGQTSMVFKYPDQSNVFYQCQIRLTLKEGDKCTRTSDKCGTPANRGKRDAETTTAEEIPSEVMDVFSQSMTVFDIDDPISAKKDSKEVALLNERYFRDAATATPTQFCLSPVTFGLLIAVLVTVLLTSLVTVALLCCRSLPSTKIHYVQS